MVVTKLRQPLTTLAWPLSHWAAFTPCCLIDPPPITPCPRHADDIQTVGCQTSWQGHVLSRRGRQNIKVCVGSTLLQQTFLVQDRNLFFVSAALKDMVWQIQILYLCCRLSWTDTKYRIFVVGCLCQPALKIDFCKLFHIGHVATPIVLGCLLLRLGP
jgi:hypothetical protein